MLCFGVGNDKGQIDVSSGPTQKKSEENKLSSPSTLPRTKQLFYNNSIIMKVYLVQSILMMNIMSFKNYKSLQISEESLKGNI